MMLISAESINQHDCYHVIQVADDTVEFTTDYGVEYQINFMADYSLWDENAFQLVIINKNRKSSPSDQKLKSTLFYIVEDFFKQNTNIMLYICETGDGMQAARSRLFVRWFSQYKEAYRYYFQSTEVISEGVKNFAAIICRNDNPELESITRDFNDLTNFLRDKPE